MPGSKEIASHTLNLYKIKHASSPAAVVNILRHLVQVIEDVYSCGNETEIRQAIIDIGNGAGTIFIEAGTHEITETINIDTGATIVIYGHGNNTILQPVDGINIFNVTNGIILIEKLKLDLNNYTANTKGIIINETNDNVSFVRQISIIGDGVNGYGIELNSNNCRIEDCNISYVDIGINILSTDNILQGNKTLNCNTYGIKLGANNNMLTANTCSNNVIGIYFNSANYNLVSGNYCENNTEWGISLTDSNDNGISDNYCIGNDGNSVNPTGGIGVEGDSDGNSIIGNTSIDNNNVGAEDGYGIYLGVNTDDNYLLANLVSGNDDNQKDLGNNLTFSTVGHLHDGATLQLDGVNSNGGVFNFSTTGQVNFNQDVQVPNLITAGNVDGVDVSVLKTGHDNLKTDVDGFPDRLKFLNLAEINQLENIDLKTISNVQWGYLGALDQALTQASSPTFVGLTLSANLITTSTIDGVDVSDLKADVDGFPDRLKNLTAAEIQQLENIDLKTISNAQWGYLGVLDQNLRIADDVSHNKITLTAGNLVVGAIQLSNAEWTQLANIGIITISNAQWGYLGALDQALTQASSPTFGGLTLNGNLVMGGNKITGLGAPNANGEALRFENISDLVYDGALWNGVIDIAPSKNAIRDVIDFLVTALTYKGTWTPNGYPAAPVIGDYYICDADGYVAADAPTPERWYEVGDWILWNGTIWDQMRNSFGDNVISVAPDDPIQLAIDEIISIGSGVISLLAGTHNLTAPLTINNVNVNILIKGAGESTIIDLNGDRTAFTITNAKSCILRDFKIDALDLTTADEEIIDITEANNNSVIIENITITGDGTNGRGIEINSDNCKVEACTIDNVRFGILCIGNDNTIQENNVNSCNVDGIQIQGNNNSLYDNESDNNNRDGIRLNTGSYNQVNGNYIEGNAQDGIYLTTSNYNAINDNYCIGNDSNTANPQGGIVIDADSDNNNIISNTSINNNNAGAGIGYGILINNADCLGNKIKDNNCSGNDVQYKDVGLNTDIIYKCSTEEEIQDALDSIATKSGTVHILPIVGGIQLSAPILVNGNGDYVIEGEGVGTIIDCAGDRTAFNITSAKSCILRNFKIDATDLTTNIKEIITVNEINDNKITIQNITITGHAVNQNGYGINFDSDNCEVKDCHLEDINYGLVLNGASYCEISNNFFDDIKTVDINLVSASNWNVITSNIHLNGDQVIVLNASTYNNINNNNMSSITTRGIYLTNNSDFCNVSNNIINAAKNGIRLNYSDHCIISENILKDSAAGSDAGIYLTYTNRTLVSGNYIYNPFNRAIRLYYATYTNIEGNFVYYGYFGAISANDSDNVLIIGNYSNNCNQGNFGAVINLGGSFTNGAVIGNKIGGTTKSYAGDLIGIHAQGIGTDNIFIANNFIYDIINNGAGDAIGISTDVNVVNGTIGVNYITGVNTPYSINQASIVIFGDNTAYGISWNGNKGTATKDAIYDKMELIAAGGEVNTASNQGTGTGLFWQKLVSDLQFNNLKSENNRLSIALDGVSHDVEFTVNEANINHNALANYAANQHFLENVINLANINEKNHVSLANKNAEANIKHLTDAQLAALHVKYTNVEAVAAVLADDAYLKNDANDVTTGIITSIGLIVNGDISIHAGGTVDGVDVGVHAGNATAHQDAPNLIATHAGDDNAHHEVFESLVEDLSPQLGGDLDLNAKDIKEGGVMLYDISDRKLFPDKIILSLGSTVQEFSTDGTLAGNVDSVVPTEKAVKTYVDANIGISNVVEDLTPQLGGNLDLNAKDIKEGASILYDVSTRTLKPDKILLSLGSTIQEFSTDDTLGGNSDLVVPTEQAVKAYIDGKGFLASKQVILPCSMIPEFSTAFGGYRWMIDASGEGIGVGFYCDANIIDTSQDVEFLFVFEARGTDASLDLKKYMAATTIADEVFSFNISNGGAFNMNIVNTKMYIATVAEMTFAAADINGGDHLTCMLLSFDTTDYWMSGVFVRCYLK